jgi:hypothetical protein
MNPLAYPIGAAMIGAVFGSISDKERKRLDIRLFNEWLLHFYQDIRDGECERALKDYGQLLVVKNDMLSSGRMSAETMEAVVENVEYAKGILTRTCFKQYK